MSKGDGVNKVGPFIFRFYEGDNYTEAAAKDFNDVAGMNEDKVAEFVRKVFFDQVCLGYEAQKIEIETLKAHLSHLREMSQAFLARGKSFDDFSEYKNLERALAVTQVKSEPLKNYTADDHYRECYGEGEKG